MAAYDNAKRHDRASLLVTIIGVKEHYLQKVAAQALEHARKVSETHDEREAQAAMRLRDEAARLLESIGRNKTELASLRR